MTPLEVQFTAHIQKAIRSAVEEVTSDEIEKAKQRIEVRVKESVGAIAIRIAKRVELSYLGDRLIIEVRMPDSN